VKWDGLEEDSLFQRPKANVLISVTGIPEGQLEIPHQFRYKTTEVQYTSVYLVGTNLVHREMEHLTGGFLMCIFHLHEQY